jgi:hypothetical protein
VRERSTSERERSRRREKQRDREKQREREAHMIWDTRDSAPGTQDM